MHIYNKAVIVHAHNKSGDFKVLATNPGFGAPSNFLVVPESLRGRIIIAEWVSAGGVDVFGAPNGEWQYRGASMAELMALQTGGEWWRDDIGFDARRDLTLRELQAQLPWSIHYKTSFRESPMEHKHFSHALTHISKALGKLHTLVNDAEHKGCEFTKEQTDYLLADLVICALRAANTIPGRVADLQTAVEDRIEKKNDTKLKR